MLLYNLAFTLIVLTTPLQIFANVFSLNENFRVVLVKEEDLKPFVNQMTELCLIVYREYPYLYEGTTEEYLPYVASYARQNGLAALLYDQDQLIGIAIGLPLEMMRANYLTPFSNYSKEEVRAFFYLGECLLLEKYRGQGLEEQMYRELEEALTTEQQFSKICFCNSAELEVHPLKPANYQPLELFWTKQGFTKQSDMFFYVSWRHINEELDTPHKLIYWFKNI